jgi:hypothetical protein
MQLSFIGLRTMPNYREQLVQFRTLPIVVQLAVGASLGMFAINILLFVSITAGASWKIDPGIATLVGASFGFCVVAWQTGKGFKNLIRSQENQAETLF